MSLRIPAYHRPRSLEHVWELLRATPGARLVAGGTDVMVRIRDGRERPAALISLRAISGLDGITAGSPTMIGALTPVADLEHDASLRTRFSALAQAAAALGSTQIRNVATLGGNLCNASPCADLAPPLLVLEARARIEGPEGRREVPIDEFFLGPGRTALGPSDVLTTILLPDPPAGTRSAFAKHGRVAMDLGLASVALRLSLAGGRCTGVRAAAGAVGPKPWRLRAAEAALEGCVLDDDAVASARAAAEQEVLPISDLRASADYRRQLVGALLRRTLLSIHAAEVGPERTR